MLPELDKVDLVLTDPPYGIGALMKGGKNTGHWGGLSSGNPWDMELPDLSHILNLECKKIVWGGNYFPMQSARCVLAWRKLNAVPTQADFELAWTTLDMPAKMFSSASGGAMARHGHPTEKPLELMTWCVGLADKHNTNNTILDPFMGSGTTLRAAKDLRRKCIGIEMEEKYCEIAVKRLQQAGAGIMTAYTILGHQHGTAMHYDASKPDSDAFLAHMEKWLPEHGVSDYMDGYCEGILGDHARKYRYFMALTKVGSNEEV